MGMDLGSAAGQCVCQMNLAEIAAQDGDGWLFHNVPPFHAAERRAARGRMGICTIL